MPRFQGGMMSALGSHRIAGALALACWAGGVHAMPFGIYDPRSIAMGGTGVASGTSANASYLNPALLAAANRKQDRFAFEMLFAARVSDPQNLADDLDDLSTSGDALTNAFSRFNQVPPTQSNAAGLAKALGDFNNTLGSLNNKTAEVNVFASPLTIGVPGKDLGWALSVGARADVSARQTIVPGDAATLSQYQTLAQNYANSGSATDLANLLAFGDKNGDGKLDDPTYQSHIDARGAVFAEIGVSLAHEFQIGHDNLAVGITPKYVRVSTFDVSVDPQRQEAPEDNGRKDYRSSNLDIGLVKELGTGFKLGLVGKNVIARTYTTVLGNPIEVKPQVRAGLSHQTSASTVAIDVDLTENKPLAFDKPTRMAGIGAEINAGDFTKLRAGYRKDLSGNYDSTFSFGFGLSIYGVHLDVGVAGRYPKDATAALQLGYGF